MKCPRCGCFCENTGTYGIQGLTKFQICNRCEWNNLDQKLKESEG